VPDSSSRYRGMHLEADSMATDRAARTRVDESLRPISGYAFKRRAAAPVSAARHP
jgi:hypothetical protein